MIPNPFDAFGDAIKAWAAKEIGKARLDAEIASLTLLRDSTAAGLTDQINKLQQEREALGK